MGAESAHDVFRPRSAQELRAAGRVADGSSAATPSVFTQRVQWLFLDGFTAYLHLPWLGYQKAETLACELLS